MTVKNVLHTTDLVKKSLKQLIQLKNELRKQMYEYKLSLAIRKLTQTHFIKLTRRNIARVSTAIKQKVSV